MVSRLAKDVASRYSGYAAFNTVAYGVTTVVAEASTPTTMVRFDDCQNRGYTPSGLLDGAAHFIDVPIGDQVAPPTGTDGTVSIWSPATDQLWELWRLSRGKDGVWSACWGGRIDDVSANAGQFPLPYGVAASGLAAAGTVVTLSDASRGRIDHAVGLVIPSPATGVVNYPATRTDGTDASPDALPEGSRLRLSADVDVDTLGLTPLGAAIARAAQEFGFIIVDRGGAVGVVGESGLTTDTSPPQAPRMRPRSGRTPLTASLGTRNWRPSRGQASR